MADEEWFDIVGFPKYELTKSAKIRNKESKELLNPIKKGHYLYVCLYRDNDDKISKPIHRLVALTLIPNPENKPTVDHRDQNPHNNIFDNLKWATLKEQCENKTRSPDAKPPGERSISRIDKNTNEQLEFYKNIKLAAKWVFDQGNLTKIKDFDKGFRSIESKMIAVAQEKTETAFTYKWKYEDEDDIHPDEEWTIIPKNLVDGAEDYQVSTFGRIKNPKGRNTVGSENATGYLITSIGKKEYSVHRIVAFVYIKNTDPVNKTQVNHMADKQNNCVINLEWVTPSENIIHSYQTGRNSNTKPLIQYNLNGKKLDEFKYASLIPDVNHSMVNACCRNERHKTANFRFQYKYKKDRDLYKNNKFAEKNAQRIEYDKEESIDNNANIEEEQTNNNNANTENILVELDPEIRAELDNNIVVVIRREEQPNNNNTPGQYFFLDEQPTNNNNDIDPGDYIANLLNKRK